MRKAIRGLLLIVAGNNIAVLQDRLNACRLFAYLRRNLPKTKPSRKTAKAIAGAYEWVIHPILYGK